MNTDETDIDTIKSNNQKAQDLLNSIDKENMKYINASIAHKMLNIGINIFMDKGRPNKFQSKMEELTVKYYAPKDIKKCYSKLIYVGSHNWQNGTLPVFVNTKFEEILADPVRFATHTFPLLYPDLKHKDKSFSWSLCPKGQLPYFKAFGLAILCCGHENMQLYFDSLLNKLSEDIKTCIINKDVAKLKTFALPVKTLKLPEMTQTYPELLDENTVPIVWLKGDKRDNKNSRRAAVQIVAKLDLWSKISINDTMANCIGLFKKMSGKKLKLTDKLQEYEQSQQESSSKLLVPIRLDYFNGYVDSIYVEIEHLKEYVKQMETSASIHERCIDVNANYRFFMDIDVDKKDKGIKHVDINSIKYKL